MVTAGHRSREEWQELDRQHYLHPFTDHKELAAHKSRIITRADGIYIYDADGNERFQAAQVVVLACNGVGTPRIL